jgi:nucleoid DNA-binding protein
VRAGNSGCPPFLTAQRQVAENWLLALILSFLSETDVATLSTVRLTSGSTKKLLSIFAVYGDMMAKKKPGKTVTSAPVIKQTLTKSALINLIAEQNDIPRKTAVDVFNTLESVMLGSVHPRGIGEFTLPGLLKITLRKVPARKAGTLIRNPATGEMMKGAAKPASVRVKIRALSKLKGAAIS